MPRSGLLVTLVLAACAAPAPRQPESMGAPATMRDLSDETGWEIVVASEGSAMVAELPIAPAAAWPALVTAYGRIGIPLTGIDQERLELGNTGLELRRTLGGQPLSTYIDCGTSLSGKLANVYRVRLDVRSSLTPAAQGASRLHTRVAASASEGSSSSRVSCRSTGDLEGLIAHTVAAEIARNAGPGTDQG